MKIKEYKNYCKDNASISSQDLDLNKLAALCLNIHKEANEEKRNGEKVKNENGKQEILKIENIEEMNKELEFLNKNIDNYINE